MHIKRCSTVPLILASLIVSCANNLETENPMSLSESPVNAAWIKYRDTLQQQREAILQNPFSQHPMLRAQGLYFLQSMETVAFNLYMAPRHQYPALYVQSVFMPFELSWGLPNPDFVNHNGFIDGAHTYRVYGKRKGNYWTTLQVFKGFWGDDVEGTLAHVDFDELPVTADGSFEIFLGPNPPADTQGKFWVQLDPKLHNNMLALREVYYDWERDVPLDLHIEILDRASDAPIYFDEQEMAARIDRAHKFAAYTYEFATGQLNHLATDDQAEGGTRPRNQFVMDTSAGQHGGNPLAAYVPMIYDLGPDDALIIEMPVAEARYWGFQLGSVWSQTTDYSYHHSSINGAQARLDADGRFRAVISLQDPGVPNWLDPAGVPIGIALLRWYKSSAALIPTVKKVKFTELLRHLPPDTPTLSARQRSASLERRRVASLRRYGQ